MKQLFLIILLQSSIMSYGQFANNDKYLGGDFQLNFLNTNQNDQYNKGNSNYFSINPSFGYFLSSKFAVGMSLGFATQNNKSTSQNGLTKNKAHTISPGLFASQFFEISDKFLFSITGSVNYNRVFMSNSSNSPSYSSNNKITRNGIAAGLMPSFVFFPTPKWGFEASIGQIGYRYSESSGNQKASEFLLSYGNISFGLNYFF